nr:hypothetical protein [uncultured Anaerostipes sp.]
MKCIRNFAKFLKDNKKEVVYQGTSVTIYQKIRDSLEQDRIPYKQEVMDTASMKKVPFGMYFLAPIFRLALRAFHGSGSISEDELKTYRICVKHRDIHRVRQNKNVQ